jgi:hypothetical protein
MARIGLAKQAIASYFTKSAIRRYPELDHQSGFHRTGDA